jgi:hypothetical protein
VPALNQDEKTCRSSSALTLSDQLALPFVFGSIEFITREAPIENVEGRAPLLGTYGRGRW